MDTWQVFIIYEVGIRFIIYKGSTRNLNLIANQFNTTWLLLVHLRSPIILFKYHPHSDAHCTSCLVPFEAQLPHQSGRLDLECFRRFGSR